MIKPRLFPVFLFLAASLSLSVHSQSPENNISLIRSISPGPTVGDTIAVDWNSRIVINGSACTRGGCLRDVKIWSWSGNLINKVETGVDYFISSVRTAPGGKMFTVSGAALSGAQWKIEVWSYSGDLLFTKEGPDFSRGAEAVFGPDGSTVAGLGISLDGSGTVIFWDLKGNRIAEHPIPGALTKRANDEMLHPRNLTFSNDGKSLLFISGRSVISRLNLSTGKISELLNLSGQTGNSGMLAAFAVNGKNETAAVISEYLPPKKGRSREEYLHRLLLISESSERVITETISDESGRIGWVELLSDSTIISGGTKRKEEERDGITWIEDRYEIIKYSPNGYSPEPFMSGAGSFKEASVSQDGKIAVLAGQTIRVTDSSGTLLSEITAPLPTTYFLDQDSKNGTIIAGPDPIRVFDKNGKNTGTYVPEPLCYRLGFNPEGNIIQIYHRGFKVLSPNNGSIILDHQYSGSSQYSFLAEQKADTIVFPVTEEEAVIWNTGGAVKGSVSWSSRNISVSPDGKMILLYDQWVGLDPELITDTGHSAGSSPVPPGEIAGMAVNSQGSTAWITREAASEEYSLFIFTKSRSDAASARLPFAGYIPEVAILWSPDNSLIAVYNPDEPRFLIFRGNGTLIGEAGGHSTAVSALTFTDDSTGIISASYDGELRIWEIVK
ncbi:MAG: WD40 repeat domain-containing protein [Spirochaetia bacterium]